MDYQSLFTFILEMAGTIAFRSNGRSTERNGYFRDLRSGRGDSRGRWSDQRYYSGNRAAGDVSESHIYHCGNGDVLYCICHNVLETGTAGGREPDVL